MEGVDPKIFEYAIQKIENGFIFEDFASSYLSYLLEYSFAPSGGIKDRGIDGLEHIFHREGYERKIYQSSIEKDSETKLRSTIKKLLENNIVFDQLFL